MFGKIVRRSLAAFRQTSMTIGFDVASQNLLPQSARTAVYQQLQTV